VITASSYSIEPLRPRLAACKAFKRCGAHGFAAAYSGGEVEAESRKVPQTLEI
jgi:hypothetical protein